MHSQRISGRPQPPNQQTRAFCDYHIHEQVCTTAASAALYHLITLHVGIPSLFAPYEKNSSESGPSACKSGILEVQAVTPPNPRSWFLDNAEVLAGVHISTPSLNFAYSTYRTPDGKMLIMTPIDPIFLLLPIMRTSHPVRKYHLFSCSQRRAAMYANIR